MRLAMKPSSILAALTAIGVMPVVCAQGETPHETPPAASRPASTQPAAEEAAELIEGAPLAQVPVPKTRGPLMTDTQRGVGDARVKQILEYLASDAMAGRDTPSHALEVAADFIEADFARAGLELVGGQRSHRFELPGMVVDSTALQVSLKLTEGAPRELKPDEEIRLHRPGGVRSGEDVEAQILRPGDDRMERILMSPAGRQPMLVEVSTDSPVWKQAAGRRVELAPRRQGGRPIFLLKSGLLEGLDVKSLSFAMGPVRKEPVKLRNPMGLLRGATKPDEYVLVTAHYDHVGVRLPRGGGDAGKSEEEIDWVFNGADDNATGTTGVLTLAERFAAGPRPARSLLFVCFAGEEKGLRGSRAFAEDSPIDLKQISVVVNLEMLGRPDDGTNYAWITGVDYSDFAEFAGRGLARGNIELREFGMAERLFGASDNFPFAAAGVVAHSISAGSLHADYHKPGDEADRIDVKHMTAVIGGLAEVVLEFADSPTRPKFNDAGLKFLERAKKRRRR